MIGKIAPRGKRVGGLVRYLFSTGPAQQEGRGRRNPHVDPRVIDAYEHDRTITNAARRSFKTSDERQAALERATLKLLRES